MIWPLQDSMVIFHLRMSLIFNQFLISTSVCQLIDTFRPEQDDPHLTDEIFRFIYLKYILNFDYISTEFVFHGLELQCASIGSVNGQVQNRQ